LGRSGMLFYHLVDDIILVLLLTNRHFTIGEYWIAHMSG